MAKVLYHLILTLQAIHYDLQQQVMVVSLHHCHLLYSHLFLCHALMMHNIIQFNLQIQNHMLITYFFLSNKINLILIHIINLNYYILVIYC